MENRIRRQLFSPQASTAGGTLGLGARAVERRRGSVLGVLFDMVDYETTFKSLLEWHCTGRKGYFAMVNPHSVLLTHRDAGMRDAVDGAGLILPDGVGIIWAATLLGYAHHGRVTGPTLMLKFCEWGRERGLRHYFYGGAQGVAEELSMGLRIRFPGLEVAGTYCPPFRALREQEDEAVIDRINEAAPDIVWVGLGAPKQEKWMADHLGRIEATAMVGVGAAFDFHSGRVAWSPPVVRRLGLEWGWRLAMEPRRMWRRNVDSLLFLAKVLTRGRR